MNRFKRFSALCAAIALLFAATSWAEPAESQPADAAAAEKPASPTAAPEQPAPEKPAPRETQPAAKPEVKPGAIPPALAEALAKLRRTGDGEQLTVGDICEVKHYRQERLQGFGMAVDLKEIIAAQKPSTRAKDEAKVTAAEAPIALPDLMKLLNSPVGQGDSALLEKLQKAGQLSLAAVTATIPPEGVRSGDRLDCEVRALDGKSLENAYLLSTKLATPGASADEVMAVAAGPIASSGSYRGSAKVANGCLVQTDICDQFVKDDKITLVLNDEHAEFLVAQQVVDLVNIEMGLVVNQALAKALNRFNVEVTVPADFADDPVAFVTMILQLETDIPNPEKEEPPRPRFTLPPQR